MLYGKVAEEEVGKRRVGTEERMGERKCKTHL